MTSLKKIISLPELVACRERVDTGSMKNAEQELEAVAIKTGELEFRFPKSGDRFAVMICAGGESALAIGAGAQADAWPTAPPLQQLHQQVLPTGPVVLAVGSAGTTHWSASFSVREPGLVWCEYAARVSRQWKRNEEWLGTQIEVASGWEWSLAEGELKLSRAGQQLRLGLLGTESEFEQLREELFAIQPARIFQQPTKTIEWKMAVQLD
ncbi:MAG: hypothetical protein ACK6DN_13535 [Planctomycetota bacterium]